MAIELETLVVHAPVSMCEAWHAGLHEHSASFGNSGELQGTYEVSNSPDSQGTVRHLDSSAHHFVHLIPCVSQFWKHTFPLIWLLGSVLCHLPACMHVAEDQC